MVIFDKGYVHRHWLREEEGGGMHAHHTTPTHANGPEEEVQVGDDEVAHVAVVQEVGIKLVDRLA